MNIAAQIIYEEFNSKTENALLIVSNTSLAVFKRDTLENFVSNSGAVRLESGTQVSVSLISGTYVTSAFWSCFRLDNTMHLLAVFYVERNDSFNMSTGTLSYNNVRINEGGAWDTTANLIRVLYPGIYGLTVTVALTHGESVLISLLVNKTRQIIIGELSYFEHWQAKQPVDTFSTFRLVDELSVGDSV
jgi:hypothetical protein